MTDYKRFLNWVAVGVNVVLILLLSMPVLAQPAYNSCNQSLEICPNVSATINNLGANKTFCPGCEDDFALCFTANNTIWLSFQTNATGGAVQLDFTNPVFEPGKGSQIQAAIIFAAVPCDASTFALAGSCTSNESAAFTMNANLPPNQTFYVILNGNINGVGVVDPAEFTVDVLLSGAGVNKPNPAMSLDQDKLQYCLGEVATFTAHLGNCPNSGNYSWFINGALVAVTADSVFQTTALLPNDVLSVSNTCNAGCSGLPTASTSPMDIISFTVNAGPDLVLGDQESIDLQGFTDADSYVWSPNDHISDVTQMTPTVGPPVTTTYYLTGTTNGCSITDAVTVVVGLNLIIPKAFTPNEDGANDTWEIPGIENYPNCFVQIFDRWGQEVYVTTGYSEKKAWDGKKNGKLLNESVYFYVIELRNANDDVLKGNVTLIK